MPQRDQSFRRVGRFAPIQHPDARPELSSKQYKLDGGPHNCRDASNQLDAERDMRVLLDHPEHVRNPVQGRLERVIDAHKLITRVQITTNLDDFTIETARMSGQRGSPTVRVRRLVYV